MLFQADLRGVSLQDVVEIEAKRAVQEPERMSSWMYAREIIDGVNDHAVEIDKLIVQYSQDWAIDRMPNVDRALLRMASWEMLYNEEVPAAVAINEAILLAQEYSTEDSSRFINGVLGNIATHVDGATTVSDSVALQQRSDAE